jgi:crotonobetainyl-CoA:carnitine CoA-transferase CaiB-like acyl-CoA transferase
MFAVGGIAGMYENGPLQGCRVLELGSTVAGPYCGRLLADFGAEVIKIEQPDGDPARTFGEQFEGKSLTWASLSRNKRIASVNLRTDEGRDVIRRLVAKVDVLIENFRPGTMEKWGLGYDDLAALNPGIVMVRISGFGQTGPNRERPGFGIIGEGLSGLRGIIGDPDRPPSRAAVPLTDYMTGVYAALGTMMALYHRKDTGLGQCIDAALYESAFTVMEGLIPTYEKLGIVAERAGAKLPGHAPNDLFATRDGGYIHIAAGNTSTFRRLCDAMGMPELKDDPRFADAVTRNENEATLSAIITAWTTSLDQKELDKRLDEGGVPAGPIYTVADIFEDAHFRARDMLLTVPSDEMGSVTVPGVVPKLLRTPGGVRWAGRPQGADTRAVLKELLELDDAEIDEMAAHAIIDCGGTPK